MCRRKSSAMQSIEVLCASQNFEADDLSAKAKLLLTSYRRVCWASVGLCTLETDDHHCISAEGPESAMEYLRTYPANEERAMFESKLKKLFGSRWVMELVDDAMMQVREFPDVGVQYFEILSKTYLSSIRYPEIDLLETLQMERSCFYDRKKEAVLAFGLAMWGTIIPRMQAAIAQHRGMLYQIFHKAEANDLIHKNPVAFADKLRNRDPKKRKEAFTAAEVKLLMENLPRDRIGMSIRLMLGTGMRAQEILALEPRHITEDGSLISICQAVNLVKGTVVVGVPKSQDSYRDVPVPPSLRECAIYLRSTDNQYIWEAGKPGMPCNPSHFRSQFKKAIEGVEGVRVLTPHSCRHTYVSQMQALGVDIQTIQSIVGHADIDMTVHYLHVQDSIRQSAVEKFSEAFS